jgi:hypothetical protein
MAPYYSNADRLILYKRRVADYDGSQPQHFADRFYRGQLIQAQLRRPKQAKSCVVTPLRRKG